MDRGSLQGEATEGRGRDWSHACPSQGTRGATRSWRGAWHRLLEPLEGTNPAHTSVSDFWPPEL